MQILNEYTETMNTWIHSLDYDLIQRTNYSTQIPKISLYVSEGCYRLTGTVCYQVLRFIFDSQWANDKRIMENRLGFHFPFSVWNGSIYLCMYSTYIKQTEVCRFCLFSANGKREFVFLSQQTINGNRHFLCQQTFESKVLELYYFPSPLKAQIHMICLWNNIWVSPLTMYWWFSLSKFEKSPQVRIFVFRSAPNFRRELHSATHFSPKFQKVFMLSRPIDLCQFDAKLIF